MSDLTEQYVVWIESSLATDRRTAFIRPDTYRSMTKLTRSMLIDELVRDGHRVVIGRPAKDQRNG